MRKQALSAAFALSLAFPVSAQDAAPLAPSGQWKLEYHGEMCVLSRPFGIGADKLTFGIRTISPEQGPTVLIVRPSGGNRSREGMAMLAVDGTPVGEPRKYESRVAAAQGLRFDTVYMESTTLKAMEGASVLSLGLDAKQPVRVAVTGIRKALMALTACERDLKVKWGFDMAVADRVATPPELLGGDKSWASQVHYPSNARQRGETGATIIVYGVALDGKVPDCRAVVSSGSTSLDSSACDAILRYGRYKPALDAAGTPMASQQWQRVRWELED